MQPTGERVAPPTVAYAPSATLRDALGPLRTLAAYLGAAIALFSAVRIGLALTHLDRLSGVRGVWWLVPTGLRLDVMTLCPLLLPVAVATLVWPARDRRALAALVAGYLAAASAVMMFFEAATPAFLAEYDTRPNGLFLDYLAFPREVVPTVWAEERGSVVVGLTVVVLTAALVWRGVRRHMVADRPWSWGTRLAAAPLVVLVLFGGARSTIAPRGANISTAAFSGNHFANELALNSTYAVAYALYERRHEADPGALYGRLPDGEAIARVRRGMLVPDEAFTRADLPLLHRQVPGAVRERPFNLVILLEESLGAEYVGALGGAPLTPSLDRLAADGLLFTNLYATGTRTVRGIEATVTGLLPTPSSGVVKLGLAQADFFTLAALLRAHGYATDFLYGGASNFDNMRAFFVSNGFERVLDEATFPSPVFRGTWGVSDEDLVRRAHETFVAHGDRPFFAVMLSTSNHPPYEFPPGRVAARPGEPASHVAIRYADWAIGEFFRLAKSAEYFRRTVFLVVADHDTRVYGADLVPIEKFHIPALVIAPDLPPRRFTDLASQVDLPPTVLGMLGLAVEHPMPGRDLLAVPAGTPGHAFMQYDLAHAYRVGDRVVIQRPHRRPVQFTVSTDGLQRVQVDPELARDALAHVQVPAMLYRERRYRLPP